MNRYPLVLALAANLFAVALIAMQVSALRAGPPPSPALLKRLAELPGGLQAGDQAPAFALPALDGGNDVALGDLHRQKPLVLVFGSLSCPAFRDVALSLREVHREYRGDADFCLVYIREAHPAEEGTLPENERAGISVAKPLSLEQRAAAARACRASLGLDFPVLLDNLDDLAATSYGAWPRHLCVVGTDGKIVYRGLGAGDFSIPMLTASLDALSDR